LSDIPFAKRLRAELIAAITAPAATTRRSRLLSTRRTGLLALAALLVIAAATGAASRIFATPEELAQAQIACAADLNQQAVAVVPADDRSPVEVCADEFRSARQPVPPLVACAGQTVVVLPSSDPEACQRNGYQPLPAEYEAARKRAARLERGIIAIEQSADCVPIEELARRIQALLDASGFSRWKTWTRQDMSPAPCGMVSERSDYADGSTRRSIAAAVDREGGRIMVFPTPPRSAVEKAEALSRVLFDASGARCWPLDGLKDEVRRRASAVGFTVRIAVYPTPGFVQRIDGVEQRVADPGIAIADDTGRGARYEAGCAIVTGVGADDDGRSVAVELLQRGAPG
jgi:hypothetical protein